MKKMGEVDGRRDRIRKLKERHGKEKYVGKETYSKAAAISSTDLDIAYFQLSEIRKPGQEKDGVLGREGHRMHAQHLECVEIRLDEMEFELVVVGIYVHILQVGEGVKWCKIGQVEFSWRHMNASQRRQTKLVQWIRQVCKLCALKVWVVIHQGDHGVAAVFTGTTGKSYRKCALETNIELLDQVVADIKQLIGELS
ncbi:MAG: hypothetical protein BYD32DRAFT_434322 [Podila humilis]|nr:MAG: hypothetical protein BYD32DRAFT_434322 [Podila humilis]